MPLGTLIQLKWPTWPAPQESIGKEFGQIPKTKLAYWQATGPALAAYQKLLPSILKVLTEKQGPIPNSDFVWFSLYMVGPSSATAVPYIMFASEQRTQRRKAMNYIKNSKILQEYPGMQVGEWSEAPHIGNQQQKGTSEELALGKPEIPQVIRLDTVISVGDQTSVMLSFHYPKRIVKATASVEVVINGTTHYLVPSHVLMPPYPSAATDSGAPEDTDNEGFDFGNFVGDEDGSEDDPLATSIGSISSSDSDSLLSEEKSSIDSSTEPAMHSNPASSTIVDQPTSKPYPLSLDERNTHDDEGGIKCPIISIDLDYALCCVTNSDNKVASMRLPDFLSLSKQFTQPNADETQVQVLTVHGILNGYLSRTQTHIHLPNSSSYQEVYVAQFSSPVLAGDCGAMVYNTLSKRVHGHIITGSTSSKMQSAFVVPAKNVYEDITRRMDVLYPIRTDSMPDASHTSGSSSADALSDILKSDINSARFLEPKRTDIDRSEEQPTQKPQQPSIKETLGQVELTKATVNYPTIQVPNRPKPSGRHDFDHSAFIPASSKPPNFTFVYTRPAPKAIHTHANHSTHKTNTTEMKQQLGLNIVYKPKYSHKIDIVFVHGLGGTSRGTWSKYQDPNSFWPMTFLPLEYGMDQARIMTFGYDVTYGISSSGAWSIPDLAKSLLFDLIYARDGGANDMNIGKVPLIFVAHSLGGLIVKEAYTRGRNNPIYEHIVSAVSAIVFLATPHHASDLVKTASLILQSTRLGPKQSVANPAMASFDPKKLNEQFRNYASMLDIVSFFETLPSRLGPERMILVDRDSSVLGYPGEISDHLNADHHSICKYESPYDPNYSTMRDALKSLVSKIAIKKDIADPLYLVDRRSISDLRSFLAIPELPDVEYKFLHDQWADGTNEWILEEKDFLKWRNAQASTDRMLWLSGGPATGKSVLSSFIVNHLAHEGLSCQYFFFRFGDRRKRSLSLLLRSLAYQVAQSIPSFLQRLTELRSEAINFATADPRLIWDRIFTSILFKQQMQHPLYWVIDGLDEATDPQAVIRLLSDTPSSSQTIRILFSGRATPEIMTALQKFPETLALRTSSNKGHLEDLRHYIQQELNTHWTVEFTRDIEQRLVERSRGIFLWAHLAVQNVNKCFTRTEAEKVLETLPEGMESIYDQMASSITEISAIKDLSLAMKILQWVTCSLRCLKVSELDSAIGHVDSVIPLSQKSILNICSRFLIVDDDGKVAMVHETARQYLLQPGGRDQPFRVHQPSANKEIFLACMQCLMSPSLSKQLSGNAPPTFLNYASQYWSSHLVASLSHDPDITEVLEKFLTGNGVLAWIHALAIDCQFGILIRASKDLSIFAVLRRYENPFASKIFESWAVDLPRIVGKFSNLLRRKPESIYQSIPLFCPKSSSVYKLFGTKVARELTVNGPSMECWDDYIARISLGHRLSNVLVSSIVAAGSRVAILASTGSVYIYDSSDFREVKASPITPGERTYLIVLNNTATLLGTYGVRTTKVWEVHSGKCIASIENNESKARALTMLFANNNSTLFIGTDDRRVRSLKLDDPQPAWRVVAELNDPMSPFASRATHMALNEDGSMVAMANRGYPLSAWETDGPVQIGLYQPDNNEAKFDGVRKLVWQPHTNEIIGLSDEGSVFKWAPLGDKMETISTQATTLSMSLDGVLVACGNDHGRVQIYEVATFSMLYQLDTHDSVRDLTFSPDSRRFYDIRGSYAIVWEPNTLVNLAEEPYKATDSYSDAETVWSSSSKATIAVSETVSSIMTLAGSPTGRLYCYTTEDGIVTLYDTRNDDKINIYSSSAYLDIEHLCWSSDGRYICFNDASNKITLMSITKWIGDRHPVDEQTATIKLGNVGKITQILLYPELSSFLVCTSSQIFAISPSSSVKQSRRFEDMQIRWLVHPNDPTFLLGFGVSEVYLLDREIAEIHRYSISWPLHDTTDLKVDEPTEKNKKGYSLDPILVTHDKKHILLKKSHLNDHRLIHELYSVATSAFSTPLKLAGTGTPQKYQISGLPWTIHPSPLSADLISNIEFPLAFLPGDRLIFLSKSFAVCSVRLRWGTSSLPTSHSAGPSRTTKVAAQSLERYVENSVLELFALPGDWISWDCLEVCSAWVVEGALLCPRNGKVAIIKCKGLA